MNSQIRLAQITVKLDRAREHLTALTAEVQRYMEAKPYAIGTRRDAETRRLIYFLTDVRPMPARVSALLGDTLHNLRSTLDHLAYQLVLIGTGKTPSTNVYFPIADDQKKYLKNSRLQIAGASPSAIALLDSLQPYKGGNDKLWQLHRLNNVDKHRALITAGSGYQDFNLGAHLSAQMATHIAASPMAETFGEIPVLDFFLKPKDRKFPLKAGDTLFVDAPDAKANPSMKFRFDVAFGEQGVAFGLPIVETLASLVALVESIPPQFEPNLR